MIRLSDKTSAAKKLLLSGISILALGACSMNTESNSVTVAQQSYTHMRAVNINASDVRFSVASVIGNEQLLALFAESPDATLQSYLNARFKSSIYGDGKVSIDISDLIFDRVRVSGGKDNILGSLLEFNDNYKYTLRANVSVISQNRLGLGHGNTSFDVNKSLVLPSHFSLARKERHVQEFLDDFIIDLDRVLNERLEGNVLTSDTDISYGAGLEAGEGDSVGYRYQDGY
jgi:hypothetical protein|tara:strand:- start:320569 stop:321258 length:690 start_codon:yes stop_codon:yes gene_type:complete